MKTKRFQYEIKVIDSLLKLIKENQEFLTEEENLPQLAKLGFMFNILFSAGRLCYGYDGIIYKSRKGDCENNPKYQIEDCQPTTNQIENLIYDAWCMHIRNEENEENIYNYEQFKNLLLDNNKEYSEIELLQLHPNKTMDDWITIKSHPQYQYRNSYPNERRIKNYLLCTIGIGYKLENGYIVEEAGGADIELVRYGKWENAVLDERLILTVSKILEFSEVKEALDLYSFHLRKWGIQREAIYLLSSEEKKNRIDLITTEEELNQIKNEIIILKDKQDEKWKKSEELVKKEKVDMFENKIKDYYPYYPICEYSIIAHLDENSHHSYIKTAIEICEDILNHKEEELTKGSHGVGNIKFAEQNLSRLKLFLL